MEKKNSITSTYISLTVSLIAIISFAGGFISNQSKIATQLASIQTDLSEIKVNLSKRDEEIKNLTNRIIVLETERKNEVNK